MHSQDQITNVYYNTGSDYKRYIYKYDFAGRLDTVNYYFGEEGTDVSSLYKNFTNYEYNENSLVQHQNYGGTFLTNSYIYNNRNWVTQLYNSISQFVFDNEYYKNGNVKSQYFYGSYRDNFVNTDDLYFTYNYDRSNRLTNVSNEITQDNTYHLENTYDKDGNITKLIRYGDTNTIKDNFNYEYNSGTNKLNNVSGTKDQFSYDLNGNMIDDKLNVNYDIKYDHRNLIIEIYHKRGASPTRVTLYATRYFYDEAGNRNRKLIYSNSNENAGPILDWNNLSNPGNGWMLFQNEFYVRGINGNELATYNDTTLVEWYVQGNGIEGKIKGTTGYYFYKDHLGSVRAVYNDNGELVSAQDYDPWGYLLQNRIFDSDSTKFKFTSKERDGESEYDYFGARYYDARIGRWEAIDPMLEKHFDFNPYNYVLNNPLIFYDPNGMQVFLGGESYQESKGLGQYIDINETQQTSQNRFDNKKPRESGLITTNVGLLDPVDWITGGLTTITMRWVITLSISPSEILVQQTLKNIRKSSVKETSETIVDVSSEYAFPKLVTQLENQFVLHGEKSILKSLKSLEKNLAEHNQKLFKAKIKSSIEREIKTFEKEIQKIKQFMKEKGIK